MMRSSYYNGPLVDEINFCRFAIVRCLGVAFNVGSSVCMWTVMYKKNLRPKFLYHVKDIRYLSSFQLEIMLGGRRQLVPEI